MSKVVSLFKTGNVQEVLCEAADKGLTELVLIGKLQDGTYWLRHSPCKDIFVHLGLATRLVHEINVTVDENN